MKKLAILAALLVLIVIGYFVFNKDLNFYQAQLFSKMPGKTDNFLQNLPQDSSFTYPFKLSSGKIGVFGRIKGAKLRDLEEDPTGTVLASATDTGKIIAFLDEDANGVSEKQIEVLTGLNKPHGIAFDDKGNLYVAETNEVVKYSYDPTTHKAERIIKLFDLPEGGRHFTRSIKIKADKIYTSVGSSCDACIEKDSHRASLLVANLDGSNLKVFAKGLRNTVFFDFDQQGNIWGTDMGRDFLGDNLPPDEVNIIQEGKDYGWPYCYGDRVRDIQFKKDKNTNYCAETEVPVANLPAHNAPLGLAFIKSATFPADTGDLLVALHGSWNSSTPVGYKVVKIDIFGNFVNGSTDFITGWIDQNQVLGRPVDLLFDSKGNLFISDDYNDVIYVFQK